MPLHISRQWEMADNPEFASQAGEHDLAAEVDAQHYSHVSFSIMTRVQGMLQHLTPDAYAPLHWHTHLSTGTRSFPSHFLQNPTRHRFLLMPFVS
jgi:hypothetical protein